MAGFGQIPGHETNEDKDLGQLFQEDADHAKTESHSLQITELGSQLCLQAQTISGINIRESSRIYQYGSNYSGAVNAGPGSTVIMGNAVNNHSYNLPPGEVTNVESKKTLQGRV